MGQYLPPLPPLHRPSIPQPARIGIKHSTLVITLTLVLSLLGSVTFSYASMQTGTIPLTGTLAPLSIRLLPTSMPTVEATDVPVSSAPLPHPAPSVVVPAPFQSYPLYRGDAQKPEIALTFDDGPHPYNTPQVLAILHQFGIQATFFCVGYLVTAFPNLVRQEYAAGDLVGDHSWSHPFLPSLSAAAIRTELTRTSDAIYATIGVRPTFFRPPYGAFNDQVLVEARSLHLTTVIWNDEARDWSLPGVSTIIARILWYASNGAIILLHDGGGNRQQTIAALPTIITTLEQRGFRFVTLRQLVVDLVKP